MHTRGAIQRCFGWVLMLLFSFSITPRQLLHDSLADHTDLSVKLADAHSGALSKTGFSCDRLSLVAESPFIESAEFSVQPIEVVCTDFIIPSIRAAAPRAVVLPGLRGPPGV